MAQSSCFQVLSLCWAVIPGGSLLLAWQLNARRVLIVGGGNVAADRLRSVLPTGAKVTLTCPEAGLGEEAKYRVVQEGEQWGLDWRDREFQDSDVEEEVRIDKRYIWQKLNV